MLLFGPEGLEGQKIREAQHEFSNARACECFASDRLYFTATVNAASAIVTWRLTPDSRTAIGFSQTKATSANHDPQAPLSQMG
jgi:hypothetical protein